MTNKSTQVTTAKTLALLSVLLLAACDGGIFGTGGSADLETDNTVGLPTDAASQSSNMDAATPESQPTNTEGETAGTTNDSLDTSDGATDSAGTADNVTSGTTGSDSDNTAGSTDGSSATAGDTGGTDSTTDVGTTDSHLPILVSNVLVDENGVFTNTTPALNIAEPQVVIVNTSSLTLNVFSVDTNQEAAKFEINGLSPNTSSDSTSISTSTRNLTIVDADNPTKVLVSYSDFNAAASTLTTLLIRDDGAAISSVALITETQTSDPGLSKVRIVQAGTLGDASLESLLRLQSAGDNPGGVESTFGPLSFYLPQSSYTEVFAGDYELLDLANRITPFAVTLTGNTVYTLLLTGDGEMNEVKVIVDSERVLFNP